MFKTLSGLTDNAFWRVSADTKTCGSPLKLPFLWRFVLYQTFFVCSIKNELFLRKKLSN